jgi:hypothetical protein
MPGPRAQAVIAPAVAAVAQPQTGGGPRSPTQESVLHVRTLVIPAAAIAPVVATTEPDQPEWVIALR